jgi:hypothetical protein
MKAIFGRIGRLEDRYRVRQRDPFSMRILLVHPQNGLTGVAVD